MKFYERKSIKLENGETYSYVDTQKGDKIVLLIHGNLSSIVYWFPLIEKLENKYRVIAMDLRGYGNSSYNKPFNHLDELADDVYDFCKKLNITNAAVAGWSTGGDVTLSLAARYDGIVERILLVDAVDLKGYPVFKKDENGKQMYGHAYANKEEMALDRYQVAPVLRYIATGNVEKFQKLWDLSVYTANKKPNATDYPILLKEAMKQRSTLDAYWGLATFNMSNEDTSYAKGNGLISKVTCPVMSFWGDKDITVTFHQVKDNMKFLPQTKLVTLPESGHSPINDQLDLLAQNFIEFIG